MLSVIIAVAIIFCVSQVCTSLSLSSLPPQAQHQQHQQFADTAAIVQRYNDNSIADNSIASTSTTRMQHNYVGRSFHSSFHSSPQFLLSASTPEVQTQSQQMSDAMVIKTMRGTQWRVVEDRITSGAFFGKKSPRYCRSLVTFGGFASVDNKGTVGVEYFCRDASDDTVTATTEPSPDNNDALSATTITTTKGRWVTKPSRLARGSVQLSARWKVRLPNGGGTVIYKGFIDADKIIGRTGKKINAEMVGVILTGEEVNKEKVIGKFTADFVRQLSEEEQSEIAASIAANDGPITMSPK